MPAERIQVILIGTGTEMEKPRNADGIIVHEPAPGCEHMGMPMAGGWAALSHVAPTADWSIRIAQSKVLSRAIASAVVGVCERAHEYLGARWGV